MRLAFLALTLCLGCLRPVSQLAEETSVEPDGGVVADPGANSGPAADAGDVLIRCASYPLITDAGAQAFRIWITGMPSLSFDAGGVADGGFRLRAWLGPLHLQPQDPIPDEVDGSGVVGIYPQEWRLGVLDVAFGDGGTLHALESYLPEVAIGPASYEGASADVWCWPDHAMSPYLHYDAQSGVCRDTSGQATSPGYAFTIFVRESGDGECTRLDGDLTEGDPNSPTLSHWNLRGADLTGAVLHHAALSSAELAGANLSALDYQDATISGSLDAFTQLPPSCSVSGGEVTCRR